MEPSREAPDEDTIIPFAVKKYYDGRVPFEDAADGAGVDAESLSDCTPEQKKQIAEWVSEHYWEYLPEATEAEHELVSVDQGRLYDPVQKTAVARL
jgi:hypothetical protein